MTFADLFILGLLAHLLADWFFQDEWEADNKSNLRHPAAWAHFAKHAAFLTLVWVAHAETLTETVWVIVAALMVAVSHALIDTRKPLVWWRTLMRQTQWRLDQSAEKNAIAVHVAFWQDQAAHMLVLGIVAAVLS